MEQLDHIVLTNAGLAFKSFAESRELVFRYTVTKELKLLILSAGIGISAGLLAKI